MPAPFTLLESLHESIAIPESGILSKPIFSDPHLRVTLFGMSQGEEMTEHTTTMEALIQFLSGSATVTLDGQSFTAVPGTWIQLDPNVPHSITALEPVKFMLIVLREN